MMTSSPSNGLAWVRAAALAFVLPATVAPAVAQVTQSVVSDQRGDGALWFQSLPPRKALGSAQLADLDTGEPPAGLGMQAIWLEWTLTNVYASAIGGGLLTAEILTPAPSTGPMAGVLGAATLNGGFVLTFDGSTLTDVVPGVGSFLWTGDKLYLAAIGGGIAVAEVTAPGGGSIAEVQGIALIDSGIYDFNPTPEVAEPHLLGAALVYTPGALYHVDVDLSGGVSFSTLELSKPPAAGGGPIAKVRGATVVSAGFAFGPVPAVVGSVFVWTDSQLFLITRSPAVSVATVPGVPDANIWGVMTVAQGGSPFRGAALVWQAEHVYLAALLPGLVVTEVVTPAPASAPIVSDVTIPARARLRVLRQASYLHEVRAVLGSAPATEGQVIGLNQRGP